MHQRRDNKRILAIFLTLCLVITGIDPVLAVPGTSDTTVSENDISPDVSVSEDLTEEETSDEAGDTVSEDALDEPVEEALSSETAEEAAGDTYEYETGYIPVEMDVPDTYYPEGCEEPAGDSLPATYLPNISTEITSVKNQGQEGICWAFSACAVLEQSAIKTGTGSLSTNYNEHQLNDAFTVNHKNDPLNLTAGDISLKNIAGNNNLFTTWLLASQVSPVDQTENQSAGYEARTASLIEAKIIQADNINEIKQAIMDYGAVTIAIDSTNYNGTNKLTYGYRQQYHYNENHAVTLIGWDDNIDSSRFGDKNGDKSASASYNICPGNGGFKFKIPGGPMLGSRGISIFHITILRFFALTV